jgi:hypothetical protein
MDLMGVRVVEMTSTLTSKISWVGNEVDKIRTVLGRSPAVVSIDAGTSLTKVVLLRWHDGQPHLEDLMCLEGKARSPVILPGKQPGQTFVGGIGGHGVRTYFHRFPAMPKKDLAKVITRTVTGDSVGDPAIAWDAARTEPGQTEVLAASAPKAMVAKSFEEMERDGTTVSHIYPDVLALRECLRFLSPETEASTVAVVNIGNRWTQVAVLDHGRMVFSRSVELGTADMFSGVSQARNIPETEAADLILSKGIDISYLPEDLEERAAVEVLREVSEQMGREILRSLAYVSRESKSALPERLFICGGGALIPNLAHTLETETGIEAEILDPLRRLGKDASSGLAGLGSIFCVAVGLGLLALRASTLNLLPQDLRMRKTRRTRAAATLTGALISLVVVLLTTFLLNSTKAGYDRLIASRSSVAASLIEMLGPDDQADREFLEQGERSYIYSLVVKPQPRWIDVLTEISNMVPAGVLLDEMLLQWEPSESGDQDVWRISGAGAVTNPDLPPTILTRIESEMESSPVFRDVRVTPVGSTVLNISGKRIDGAILFEMGLCLE